ncbi:MAG: ArsR family transcriptional regulator [Candidatus Neomarinimicrobiota bacterium]|nr:MAG: ArsR family transcriptional regulator [Candidatus Neomarinimicrobiota bacterium]
MRDLIKIFKALSDENRIRILKMLEIKPLCVCEITDILNLATSTVSNHLSILRDTDLIIDVKDGRWVNYSLNYESQKKYAKELRPLLANWLSDNKKIISDAIKASSVDRKIICST